MPDSQRITDANGLVTARDDEAGRVAAGLLALQTIVGAVVFQEAEDCAGGPCLGLYSFVVRCYGALLMDADGLIKLHRGGVLALVVRTFSCAVPQAAYEEVVTRGKARLYEDAGEIEAIISNAVTILPVQGRQQPELGLGAGELGILSFLVRERDCIVVSDDRRFLATLTTQGSEFLTPADMLVVLGRRGILTRAEAREALERLRPVIREAAYREARQDLEIGRESDDEEQGSAAANP